MTLLGLLEETGFPLGPDFLTALTEAGADPERLALVSREHGAKERADSACIPLIGESWRQALDHPAADQGIAFLSTAAPPQPFWLQILQNAAAAYPDCGAISPLWGDFLPAWTEAELPTRNALLWAQKDKIVLETEDCAEHCLYLSPRAVRHLRQAPPDLRLRNAGAFLRRQGFSPLVHGNLFLPSLAQGSRKLPDSPALLQWRHVIGDQLRQGVFFRHSPGLDARPVQLHIIHSWGGGLEKWCRDFCAHDTERINLVLRSVGTWGAFGQVLELFSDLTDKGLLGSWTLGSPIRATDIHNAGYAAAIREIIDSFQVKAILVSSLIGHSLDALTTGLPTAQVIHDYYPYCPVISTFTNTLCRTCTSQDLASCHDSGAMHAFFDNIDDAEWTTLRQTYFDTIRERNVTLVAPTPAAKEHLETLDARYRDVAMTVIEHGNLPLGQAPSTVSIPTRDTANARPHVLLLGELRPEKGEKLFSRLLPALRKEADVFLVGCGDSAAAYAALPGVFTIRRYDRAELGSLLARINPDMALFLSVWPETYCYTLSEVWQAGIPPLAPNLGAFAARIKNRVTGFLCPPEMDRISSLIHELLHDPAELERVRVRIQHMKLKTAEDMTADYNALLHIGPCAPACARPRLYVPSQHLVMTQSISPGLPFYTYVSASRTYLRIKYKIFQKQSKIKQCIAGLLLSIFSILEKLIKK